MTFILIGTKLIPYSCPLFPCHAYNHVEHYLTDSQSSNDYRHKNLKQELWK